MKIVAYAADAALYCVACAHDLYGVNPTDPADPEHRDREGNPVHPVFEDAHSDQPEHCNACQTLLAIGLSPEGEQYVQKLAARGPVPDAWRGEWPWLFDR
ncbi:hypothetical protein Sulac_1132 [Sulfobacillus acidophilus DSM 10332]|uniref:Uncharacterized protein n=1 Tax=Sulfobacillus acidophilus (strain ATCC 700253 / DSM 10332 / NAL) TaxID=679936 RepID=G8TUI5_SULAD|nr:hypothetical protein Sulac_1132 [Sulfobacillus acidophilus DSM 10332]